MNSRGMWLATAALASVACAWTVTQGVGFVRYQLASDRWMAEPANVEGVLPWTGERGLAVAAIETVLRAPVASAGPAALKGREDMLSRLLAIKPTSSQAWLSLASVRHALGLPPDRIDAAFMMSGLTGPSEGALMLERSLLGILLWETSSPNARSRTMTDLCGLPAFEPSRFRLLLGIKTEAVRAEIRAAMDEHACAARTIRSAGF